jgi:hypothetical protein
MIKQKVAIPRLGTLPPRSLLQDGSLLQDERPRTLEVSLKEVSIGIIDGDGQVVTQGTAPAAPEGVAGWFKNGSFTCTEFSPDGREAKSSSRQHPSC